MLLLSLLIDWHASAAAIAESCTTHISAYQRRVASIEHDRAPRSFHATVLPLERATAELRNTLARERFLAPDCAQHVEDAIEHESGTPPLYAALLAAEGSNTAKTSAERTLTEFWLTRSKRAGGALGDPARAEFLRRMHELREAEAHFGADSKNVALFEHVLALRNRLAHLQGYESWSDYALADRMARNPMRVEKFLRTSIATLKPASDAQEQRMRDHRRRRGEFDPQSVRRYLPREQTVDAILAMFGELLNISIVKDASSSAWAPDVSTYTVSGAGMAPRSLYLDLVSRPGKPRALIVKPIVAVIGSLPENLSHDEVVALFGAFGQSLAAILAAAPYDSLNALRDDFADAPGQMFENFAWQPDVLRRLGIPDDLAPKLMATRTTSNAYDMSRDLQLAWLDQQYHTTAHPRIAADPLAAFDATYYSDAWAHAYAADLFTAFSSGTVLDPAIGVRFRQDVLAPAGSLEPDVEVTNFLGRPMNADAFYKEFNIL